MTTNLSPTAKTFVVLALLWHLLRCGTVVSRDGFTPFISANDRSRWCTVVSLVDYGTYEIDEVIAWPGWNTIDKVYHYGKDGEPHYYSSKPPLFPTMMAAPYWVLQAFTGWTFAERPFLVGRLLLMVINTAILGVYFWAMLRIIRRYATSEASATLLTFVVTWCTFLTTFSAVINNHLPAAAAVAVALYCFLEIWLQGRDGWGWFAGAGVSSAFAVACELPALSFCVAILVALLIFWPRQTMLGFVPMLVVVAAGFFGTNWMAHDTLKPAYAHRVDGETWEQNNWYNYPRSYWLPENRRGVDRGESSVPWYALHVTIGHHGILSLSPIWFACFIGLPGWLRKQGGLAFVMLCVSTTAACLVFYIVLRSEGDRNYGGVTSAFRWAFWLIPMWVASLVPWANRAGKMSLSWATKATLLFCCVSALYGSWRPFTHPWLYEVWKYLGGS